MRIIYGISRINHSIVYGTPGINSSPQQRVLFCIIPQINPYFAILNRISEIIQFELFK